MGVGHRLQTVYCFECPRAPDTKVRFEDISNPVKIFLFTAAGLEYTPSEVPVFHLEGEMANSGPRIEIEYCTKCRWLIRAAWMAQELLSTFEEELEGVALVPGTEGGIFEVRLAGAGVIWSRKAEGRFPEITELKRMVRDLVAPERDLGHSDQRD